jgi:hypothetical protein
VIGCALERGVRCFCESCSVKCVPGVFGPDIRGL